MKDLWVGAMIFLSMFVVIIILPLVFFNRLGLWLGAA